MAALVGPRSDDRQLVRRAGHAGRAGRAGDGPVRGGRCLGRRLVFGTLARQRLAAPAHPALALRTRRGGDLGGVDFAIVDHLGGRPAGADRYASQCPVDPRRQRGGGGAGGVHRPPLASRGTARWRAAVDDGTGRGGAGRELAYRGGAGRLGAGLGAAASPRPVGRLGRPAAGAGDDAARRIRRPRVPPAGPQGMVAGGGDHLPAAQHLRQHADGRRDARGLGDRCLAAGSGRLGCLVVGRAVASC